MSVSSMPESGVASPSTLPGRCERSRGRRERDTRRRRRRRRGAARSRRHPRWASTASRGAAARTRRRDASTSSAVTSLRNIAFGLCTPWRRFFTTTAARCVLREPVLAQQPLRAQREVRGRRREPGLLAPRLEERRADDALRHLLDAEHEHAVVLAGADRARRELQRGAAARAAGFDVDDRHAGARERAEHLVARRDPAVRGAAERGVERRVAGFGERGAHRVHAHVGVRQPVEPAERVDADAGDLDAVTRLTARTPTSTELRRAARRPTSASAGRTSSRAGRPRSAG